MQTARMTADLLARLAAVATTCLSDAAGAVGADVQTLDPRIRPVSSVCDLTGRVVTADANADLTSVLVALSRCGPGDVLVVAAGGLERAVAGELFSSEAQRRGVAGLVTDGRCRDGAGLADLSFPVFARGVVPAAYPARRLPAVGVPIHLDGVQVRPGDLIRGDRDGLVIGSVEGFAAVIELAESIRDREARLLDAIRSGRSLFEAINLDQHLEALSQGEPASLVFGELDR